MCKEMEVLIKNYKTNDTSKKRNEKRERELGVLTLFKQYGIKLIKLEKQEGENKNNETKEERPPPYSPSCDQAVNQMPVVQGRIDLKGPIEFEGYLHDENTDEEKEQSCTGEVRGTVGNKEKTHTHTAMREGLEQPRERLRTSTPLAQPRQRERKRERTAHKEEPKMERERADDCREEEKTGEPPTYHSLSVKLEDLACYHRYMTSGCEGVENYQAEEPEETPERSMSPADSIQEALDEMEERCNRTEERISNKLST